MPDYTLELERSIQSINYALKKGLDIRITKAKDGILVYSQKVNRIL